MLITSLDDQYTLTEIKIVLSEKYSDEHPVTLINEDGKKDIMLFEIDRGVITSYSIHYTKLYEVRQIYWRVFIFAVQAEATGRAKTMK